MTGAKHDSSGPSKGQVHGAQGVATRLAVLRHTQGVPPQALAPEALRHGAEVFVQAERHLFGRPGAQTSAVGPNMRYGHVGPRAGEYGKAAERPGGVLAGFDGLQNGNVIKEAMYGKASYGKVYAGVRMISVGFGLAADLAGIGLMVL
ncbi:hypothetical protein Daus18300_010320 [Diaporthe australafricana]|uniref:Uncharacterized protein n=1 Tax=Diaporthe australafricana TaxID=127596 RepID=A0ABR3WAT5_9PEZI